MPDETKIDSEKQAEAARASLQLFKVMARRKLRVPPPVLELHAGANHFELVGVEDAGPLFTRLAALVKATEVTIEILDGDGKSTPWTGAPAAKVDSLAPPPPPLKA